MYSNRGPRQFSGGGGNNRFNSQDRYVPVKVGDQLAVTIEAVGEKGDGVAKKDGFVLFVPGTKQGQQVTIRVTKVFKKVGFAEVVSGASAGEQKQEESTDEAYSDDSGSAEPAGETTDYEETSESSEDSEDFGSDLEEKE